MLQLVGKRLHQELFDYRGERFYLNAQMPAHQESTEPDASQEYSVEEFNSIFEMLGHHLTEEEVREWLLSDEHDMEYAHLSDSEIVSNIMRNQHYEK